MSASDRQFKLPKLRSRKGCHGGVKHQIVGRRRNWLCIWRCWASARIRQSDVMWQRRRIAAPSYCGAVVLRRSRTAAFLSFPLAFGGSTRPLKCPERSSTSAARL